MTGTETSTISIEGVTNIEATHFQTAAENLISIPAIILKEEGGSMTLTAKEATYKINDKVQWTAPSTLDQTGRLSWTVRLGNPSSKCFDCQLPNNGHAWAVQRSYQHKIRFQSRQDLVNFVSACLGNPPLKTFLKGIELGLTFPGLDYKMARDNPPHSIHTPFGHLRASPSNFHSSKPKTISDAEQEDPELESEGVQTPAPQQSEKHPSILKREPATPKHTSHNVRFDDPSPTATGEAEETDQVPWSPFSSDTEWKGEPEELPQGIHAIQVTKKELDEIVKMFGDFTGRLDKPSCDGQVAFMIFFHSKANYIKVEPIHGGEGQSKAYHKAYEFFESKGLGGNWFIGDNAVSEATRKWFKDKGINVVIVPPYQHRANVAERMIQTFKGHFITILHATSRSFPMAFWHHLSDQAEITINLLRASRADPRISAYEYVHGKTWDWDKHPMVPPGTRCVSFVSREQRSSWGLHGRDGWYVGPHEEGYRCYKIVTREGSIIRTDTVEWFPEDIILPGATNEEQLKEILTHLHTCISKMDPQENSIAYKSKPLLQELSANLLDIYHPLGPQRVLPCHGCNKPWNDNVRDEWVECEHCSKWFCWECKTNGTLEGHERDVHSDKLPPTDTGLAEVDSQSPISPQLGFPLGPEIASPPAQLQPPPGFEHIIPSRAQARILAESEGAPAKLPETETFLQVQKKKFSRPSATKPPPK